MLQILEMRRNKRKAEGDRKHQALIEQLNESYSVGDSNTRQKTDIIDMKTRGNGSDFTDKIDEFLEIPNTANSKSYFYNSVICIFS